MLMRVPLIEEWGYRVKNTYPQKTPIKLPIIKAANPLMIQMVTYRAALLPAVLTAKLSSLLSVLIPCGRFSSISENSLFAGRDMMIASVRTCG